MRARGSSFCPTSEQFSVSEYPAGQILTIVFNYPAVMELFANVITQCWRRAGLPYQDVSGLLGCLDENRDDSERAVACANDGYLNELRISEKFARRYQQCRSRKFTGFARLLQPWINGKDLLDIGSGGTELIDLLCQDDSTLRVVACDVGEHTSLPGEAPFRRQISPDRIPADSNSLDTGLFTGVLHHIAVDTRASLLLDVHRALRPGGRLLLLEETFPAVAIPTVDNEFDCQFEKLDGTERMIFLALTDWWGNRLLKNNPHIPLPYTFQDIYDWEVTFNAAGFTVITAEYLGFWDAHSHMNTPRTLLALERV